MVKIIGIETSCDDTGIGLFNCHNNDMTQLLYSQIELHQQYGGIVPELASRDHIRKILPLLDTLLHQQQLTLQDIDGIAYTKGPGLMGALLVGATFGKSLAHALAIPCVGVHHLEAHLLAAAIGQHQISYPFVGLIVSGGHTMLVESQQLGHFNILGSTLDDAVGECFDKTAKIMGLPYPGGPQIAKYAILGDPNRFKLPTPMLQHDNYDFSFSGLKTHVRQLWDGLVKSEKDLADVARALEDTIVKVFTHKIARVLSNTKVKNFVLAGGVAANFQLRTALTDLCAQQQVNLFVPQNEYCMDNGAMVAYTGAQYLQQRRFDNNYDIQVLPRWGINNISISLAG